MEGQITLSEWIEWKEDIRQRLEAATASFVGIGYRLKQIRDNEAYKQDGYEDLYSFAQVEYNLGKSTVSRFISINDNFSINGNSLELQEEYIKFGSSKLTEMLGLSPSDKELITEQTTIKDIRSLKKFNSTKKEDEIINTLDSDEEFLLLEQVVIDFFEDESKENILNEIMKSAKEETLDYKELAKKINPSNSSSHKKGIIYMFLYDFQTGIKIKNMKRTKTETVTWEEFVAIIIEVYISHQGGENVWQSFYADKILKTATKIKEEIEEEIEEKQVLKKKETVATSQQIEAEEEVKEDDRSKDAGCQVGEDSKETSTKKIESYDQEPQPRELDHVNERQERQDEEKANEVVQKKVEEVGLKEISASAIEAEKKLLIDSYAEIEKAINELIGESEKLKMLINGESEFVINESNCDVLEEVEEEVRFIAKNIGWVVKNWIGLKGRNSC